MFPLTDLTKHLAIYIIRGNYGLWIMMLYIQFTKPCHQITEKPLLIIQS